ncbi:MAG: M15 family metallopeptidase [Sediminibacterium sp.]
MVSSKQCYAKFGEPSASNKCMTLWDVPAELEIGIIPKRIFCNRLMVEPLKKAFKNLIDTGSIKELKTWDGCFNIRKKRGLSTMSMHSWGLAIDVNAFENGLYATPKLSPTFVKCFTDAGFDWGGNWLRQDGMHFQLSAI